VTLVAQYRQVWLPVPSQTAIIGTNSRDATMITGLA